jgi:hypothetical protein
MQQLQLWIFWAIVSHAIIAVTYLEKHRRRA